MSKNTSFIEIDKELKQKEFEFFKSFFKKNNSTNSNDFENSWKQIYEKLRYIQSNKNSKILSNDTQEYALRFLIKGIIKIVKYNEEDEYVYDFRESGDPVTDIGSIFSNLKSTYSITTVVKCEWIEIQKNDFIKLVQTNEIIKSALLHVITTTLVKHENRFTIFRTMDAKTRYDLFFKQFPELVKYAKLTDIASYLGITLSSLSRIRKNS